MRKSTILSIALTTLLFAAAAQAQSVYSDTYVIPVASHTTGANGSTWMSDLTITNFQATPLNVQIIVVETGEGNFDNIFPLTTAAVNGVVTVPAMRTVQLRDVLNGHRGMQNVSGALILGGDKPFAVTSRSYSSGNGAQSVGQTVTPARDFFENATGRNDPNAVAYLTGLTSNASTRTNIGFLAGTGSGSGSTMGVEVTIRDASGTVLGKRLVTIPAGNFTHVQFPVTSITTTPFDVGTAELRIVQGLGTVVPYASVIDNSSNAAAYVMGQFPSSTPLGALSLSQQLFRAMFTRMSDR